jgi:type IV secretion system protein VirB5
MALSTMKPLVIRINDVGRAEAVDYQNFAYKPQEAENRYFLSEARFKVRNKGSA